MGELEWQRALVDLLNGMGLWAIRLNSGKVKSRGGYFQGAPTGTPDVLVIAPGGRTLWLELKEPKGKTRDSQVEWHAKAKAFGVRVEVPRTLNEAIEIVRRWRDEM